MLYSQNAADAIRGVQDAPKSVTHPTSALFKLTNRRSKRKRNLSPADLMDMFGPDDITEASPIQVFSPLPTRYSIYLTISSTRSLNRYSCGLLYSNRPFTSPAAVLTVNSYSSPFYSSPSLNEESSLNKKQFLSPHELAIVEHQLELEGTSMVEAMQHNVSSATEILSTAEHNTVSTEETRYYDPNLWAIMLYTPPTEQSNPSPDSHVESTTTDDISASLVEHKCSVTVRHSAALRLSSGWFKMLQLILKLPWNMRYGTMLSGMTAHIKSDWNRVSINSIIFPVKLRIVQYYSLIAPAIAPISSLCTTSPQNDLEFNHSSILCSVAEECTAIKSILKKRTFHESHDADRKITARTKSKEVHFDITASMQYKRWRVGKIATFCPQTALEETEEESRPALSWKQPLISQSHDDVFFTTASSNQFITSDRVEELPSQDSTSPDNVPMMCIKPDTVTPMPSILKKRTYAEVSPPECTAGSDEAGAMPKKRVHFSPDVCIDSKERTGMYQSLRRRCPWFFAERSGQLAQQRPQNTSSSKITKKICFRASTMDDTSKEHESKNYSAPFEYHPERASSQLLTAQVLSQHQEELSNSDTDTETDESVELNISFSDLPPHVDDDIPPLSEDFLDAISEQQQEDERKLSSPTIKLADPTLRSISAARGVVDRPQWQPEVEPCALGSFLDEACGDDASTGPPIPSYLLPIVENHTTSSKEVDSRKTKKVTEEEKEEEESPFFVEDAMIVTAGTAVTVVVTPENHHQKQHHQQQQQSKGDQWLWSDDMM